MSDLDPKLPAATPAKEGAKTSTLMIFAGLAVAILVGLFAVSTMRQPTASTDNGAPSLTTGKATSSPNTSGVTPQESR